MDKRFTFLVEKFLEHDLSEAESSEFKKYLDDPLCADYLKKTEKAEKFIQEGFALLLAEVDKKLDFSAEMEAIPDEVIEDVKKYGGIHDPVLSEKIREAHRIMLSRRKRTRLLTFGSAAAAILITLVLLWPSQKIRSPQQLYKSYLKPYEFIAFRSANESGSLYTKAVIEYQGFNYSASSGFCREILLSDTLNPEAIFLYGLNLMQQDSMQTAIQQFTILDSLPLYKEGTIYGPAHWYAGLSYLSMNQLDSALLELEKIIDINNMSINKPDLYHLIKEIKKLKNVSRNDAKDTKDE